MFKYSLFTCIFLLAMAAEAKEESYQVVTEIKLSSDEKLIVKSSPHLSTRKMSKVILNYIGKKPLQVLSFDAEMPDHNHGMIVKPTAPKPYGKGERSFLIEGVKLHMPGSWVLKIKTMVNGSTKEIRHPFNVSL